MRYFDHDTCASFDDKIMALRLQHGGQAVDAYWSILEMIYQLEAPLNLSETNLLTKSVSYRLVISVEELLTYLNSMFELGLLKGSIEGVYSDRAMANIAAYQARCETARQNGKKGGRKSTKKPTGNRSANQVGTETQRKGKGKVIGFDKQNQMTTVPNGAAAAGAAPPVTEVTTGWDGVECPPEIKAKFAHGITSAAPEMALDEVC